MTLIHALLLGTLEGITEFLPISSTGHLILASHLLKLEHSEFLKSFEIAIQLGAILAVAALYWRKIVTDRKTLRNVIVAFIPTAIIGLILHGFVKAYLFGNISVVLWSLFLGGIALIGFEYWFSSQNHTRSKAVTPSQAVLIGLCQSLAIIPGVSRAGATIIGGLFLGIDRRTITEFSFLLAIPTMAAATGLDLLKSSTTFSSNEFMIVLAGTFTAFVTAGIAVRWLLKYIQSHTFIGFGIYRIVIAALLWILL